MAAPRSDANTPVVLATAYPLPTGTHRQHDQFSPLAQRRAALEAQKQGKAPATDTGYTPGLPGGRLSAKGSFLSKTYSSATLPLASATASNSAVGASNASALPQTATFLSESAAPPLTGGTSGGLVESVGPDIIERARDRTRNSEVAASSLAFLYAEMVSYVQGRVSGIAELEKRLSLMGYTMGQKLLGLTAHRLETSTNGKNPKREVRLLPVLLWVHTHLYKQAFGKPADSLERSTETADEYMISTNVPLFSKSISIPKDMSQLSVEAITAGIVEAALDGLGFPARVTAHSVPTPEYPLRTTILIKLDPSVMKREEALG